MRYEDVLVKGFKDKLKAVDGFRKILKKHIEAEKEKEAKNKVRDIADTVKAVIENKDRKEKGTTQLVKPRFPPIWSGQKFDRYKKEIETWSANNKSTEEDKY